MRDGGPGPEGDGSGKKPSAEGGGSPPAGLCASCRHARRIRNRRSSTFFLCERSRTDDRYPRYPRLPVLRCPGHEVAPTAGGAGERASAAEATEGSAAEGSAMDAAGAEEAPPAGDDA